MPKKAWVNRRGNPSAFFCNQTRCFALQPLTRCAALRRGQRHRQQHQVHPHHTLNERRSVLGGQFQSAWPARFARFGSFASRAATPSVYQSVGHFSRTTSGDMLNVTTHFAEEKLVCINEAVIHDKSEKIRKSRNKKSRKVVPGNTAGRAIGSRERIASFRIRHHRRDICFITSQSITSPKPSAQFPNPAPLIVTANSKDAILQSANEARLGL